jgi:PAS domain S-box-containing protein
MAAMKEQDPVGEVSNAQAASDLRRRAEEQFAVQPALSTSATPGDAERTLHELRIHQIELEIQNEELRHTQAELDAQRARYVDLYDYAPVAYCTLSEQGLILEVNLTATTLLGVPRRALVRRSFASFVIKEDQELYYLHRKRLVETGSPQACELRMVKKDGTVFWVRVESVVARDAADNPRWRIVLIDITERKRADAEMQRLQKAESLGRMAGGVAHHFNNKLMAVMGHLELAMEDSPRSSASFAAMRAALYAVHRAADVSRSMNTYLGQTTGLHALLDLSSVCIRALPVLSADKPENVEVQTDLPEPGPVISADASQVQQILCNLLTNAFEAFGAKDGVVRVAVKVVAAAAIHGEHRFPSDWMPKAKTYACLEISDTGCGIVLKDGDLLFDPFYSTKFTGRGLGLAVVAGIVRSHDGSITVDRNAGRGSLFRVFFPVSEEAVALEYVAPDQKAGGAKAGKRTGGAWACTVLLVEDELPLRKVVATMLQHMGFTVLVAEDGAGAVDILRRHSATIDCVVSDLTMPGMNGWETLTALRKLKPGIPAILASGYDEAQVMTGEHPEWPQAFLGKPYHLRALRDTIERVVRNVPSS